MSELLNLLDAIVDVSDIYARYGIQGCLLIILFFVALFGVIAFFAFQA